MGMKKKEESVTARVTTRGVPISTTVSDRETSLGNAFDATKSLCTPCLVLLFKPLTLLTVAALLKYYSFIPPRLISRYLSLLNNPNPGPVVAEVAEGVVVVVSCRGNLRE
jgi:hypothetical protein